MEGIGERDRERKRELKFLYIVCDGLNNFSHPGTDSHCNVSAVSSISLQYLEYLE